MIGPVVIPLAYEQWNRKWHAPHGRPIPVALRSIPDARSWQVRYQGPFAFQPNNTTRRFEYPWAFHAVPVRPGMAAVDLGGGLSGFQFALAASGAAVTNVDPFSDYGSVVGYETIDPEGALDRLNRIYRTSVRLMRCDLVAADLPPASVDTVYCISTLEHLAAEERAVTLGEIGRIVRPGGHLVLTVDLFLDLVPFTDRATNRYGTNVDISEVVGQSGMKLVAGNLDELFGYPQFDANRVQANLSEYLIGSYPALAQCLVLRQA